MALKQGSMPPWVAAMNHAPVSAARANTGFSPLRHNPVCALKTSAYKFQACAALLFVFHAQASVRPSFSTYVVIFPFQ